MLWLENELGWRLYKNSAGYTIRRANLPLRRHISMFGPFIFNILYVVLLWSVGDNEKLRVALFVIPFSLVIGYLIFRPAELYINVRQRIVMGGSFFPRLPFSRFNIEINHDPETGHWMVYFKDTKPLLKTSKWQSDKWKKLEWESGMETEAAKVAEEFHSKGLGIDNTQQQEKVIKADKKIRWLVLFGYPVSVLILIILLSIVLPWGEDRLEKLDDPEVLMRIIRIVIAFIFLSIVPFGLYICRFGWRVIKLKQIPPPGTKVIVDTKIIEGEKAVTRGKIIIAISLVLIAVGLYGGFYFPYKLGKVFGEQVNQQTPQSEQLE